MAGAGRDQVQNIQQEVPKFIREFRERTGQTGKEVVDINTKRKPLQNEGDEGDSDEERPEEAPLICVSEGVTEEEAYSFTKQKFGEEAVEKNELKRKHDEEDKETGEQTDGKFVFKKPTKDFDASRTEKKSKSKGKSDMPKVKNKALLSFGDDEEEEDEDGT